MKSFKKFVGKSQKFTKHIYEYEHHTRSPHGHFGNDDVELHESLSEEENDAMVREKLAKRTLPAMWKHYGKPDSAPAPTKVLKRRIEGRFDELSKMSHSERKAEYAKANSMMKESGIGHPIASNAKTDTSADMPTRHGPNGQIPLGMSFAPDHAHHYTSVDGSTRATRNVCAGSTSACRSACLAKHGNYGFIGNRASIAGRTQRLTHNEEGTKHHATLVYAALEKATKEGKESGKSVLMRGSVTDDTGADIHHDAIKKHFPQTAQMGYTKKMSTQHDPKNGIHTIFSDSGPMVTRDSKGNVNGMERENIQRRSVLSRATQQKGMGLYVVFNRKRPSATSKKDSPEYKNYHAILGGPKTVRRYEPLPSAPGQGEGNAYHHPDGYGRVEHNGNSYRYQDHPVAQPTKNVRGETLYPAEHDSRNVDSTKVVHKTPDGKKVGHVVAAFATASTSNENLHNSGFFHHVENIHDGIYHDGHPAEMERAGFKGVSKTKIASAPTGSE